MLFGPWGGDTKNLKSICFKSLPDFTPMLGRFREGIVIAVSPLKKSDYHFRARDKIREKSIFCLFFLYELL